MKSDRYRLILAAAIGLGIGTGGFAQEAPAPAPLAPAPLAPAPETTEPPAATGTAPAGAPATTTAAPAAPAAAPAQGSPAAAEITEFVRDTFGDWQVRCFTQTEECFMYQLALDTGKNPVAEVSLLKLPAGGEATAGMTVVSPLGTLLTTGVQVQIDTNEARQYPFNWCSQAGCFSRFGLTDQSIAAMKRGKAGKMTLISVAAPQNPISLDLSLKGFTAAFDSLKAPAPQVRPSAAGQTLAPSTQPTLAPRN